VKRDNARPSSNNKPVGAGSGEQAALPVDDHFKAGLVLLRQAYRYTQDAGADQRDFAVENAMLYETGLTISDLRWLVAKGFAEHGQETSFYGDRHRSFRPSIGLNFVPTTCFVLTPKGADFAGRILAAGNQDQFDT
jgi:hypothetical protein